MNLAQLQEIAATIRQEIPGAEVRLFGSRARGQARPDSDVDLLITVSDHWLAHHDRWAVLDRLRWRISQLRSNVVHQVYAEGLRLDG